MAEKGFIRRHIMWRMFKAAIMGVLLGVVFGVVFGHISYLNYKKENVVRGIEADAVMYNSGSDEDRVIRIKVDYDGDLSSQNERDEFTSYVGNGVLGDVNSWLGDDYNTKFTYIEMRHNLAIAMRDISESAEKHAKEWGIEADAGAEFVYEFFDASEDGMPAGYYETLEIALQDK